MLDGAHALVQGRAALQYQRAVAMAGQQQGGKKPGRAKPHHDGAVHQRCAARGKAVLRGGGKADAGRIGQSGLLPFIGQGHGDRVYQHGLAAPCVHRKPCYAAMGSLRRAQVQDAQRLGGSLGIGVVQGQR